MQQILERVAASSYFKRLLYALKQRHSVEIPHANRDLALFLVNVLSRATKQDIVVVTHNLYHAQRAFDALERSHQGDVTFFPQDEFLTTDMLAMSEELKLQRLETLHRLVREQGPHMVVTHTTGLIKPIPSPVRFQQALLDIAKGERIDPEKLSGRLIELGYKRQQAVEKVGDFTRRGSILDIFPQGAQQPLRLDFFDDEVESIRSFDVESQRSIEHLSQVHIPPRSELFYSEEEKASLLQSVGTRLESGDFSEETRERIRGELDALALHEDLDRLGRYLSFLEPSPGTLPDYLEEPLLIFIDHDRIEDAYQHIYEDLQGWMEETGDYAGIGFQFLKDLSRAYSSQHLSINPLPMREKAEATLPVKVKETIRYNNNLHSLIKDLRRRDADVTTLITLADETRRDRLSEAFEGRLQHKILGADNAPFEGEVNLTVVDNPFSFEWFDEQFMLLSEDTIFEKIPQKKRSKRERLFKESERVRSVKSLEKGDFLVHYDHGIGRFLGVESEQVGEHVNDYIVIGYRGDDKLYIPVENIHLIQKYAAREGVIPKVNKLGSGEWAKTKRRVRKKASDIADQLVELYASREKTTGHAFSRDTDLMDTFEAEFMHEETPDQREAIEAVKRDMERSTPMDRLVCGDVGYGKTEVALRAAFKAVLDNKQVVYLAPTTILSRQHYYTFKERLEKHGVHVALLNRFVRPSKQKAYLEGVRQGRVDVIIGTHRLLSKDIEYQDLGLLIVDEEQRFGVEHKEKIKQMKLHIDVLSLSATPIPRTLQMAMTDVKQMSVIETPPENRFPVQTYVLRRSDNVIRDAIERELARDGQVFYLHNRIETIDAVTNHLRSLLPDARIGIAHGRMNRQRLETVMRDFLDHAYDVLVSTTIIETGIDIPNANTLIVHEADRLGLAQLYQIRGRVGRSNRIAYSYLMYDRDKRLNEEAAKRLQAIKEFTELGSGYKIAQRDLAIRGAGDLLGTEQSGFIDTVGIELFMQILREEIDKRKEPDAEEADQHVEDQQASKGDEQELEEAERKRRRIRLPVSSNIPLEYVGDDETRIELHRRIATLQSTASLERMKEELEDRFGAVPETVEAYMYEKLYERLAMAVGVERVRDTGRALILILTPEASRTLQGDALFEQANALSRYIQLAYKQARIHITLEKAKTPQPVHATFVKLLESIHQEQ